jgi:hypothetical protein
VYDRERERVVKNWAAASETMIKTFSYPEAIDVYEHHHWSGQQIELSRTIKNELSYGY